MTEDFATRLSLCPRCGHAMDRAMSVGSLTTAPAPGDMTLCIRCAAILTYGPDMLLRAVPDHELRAMSEDDPFLYPTLKQWQRRIALANLNRPAGPPVRPTTRQ